MNTKTLWVVGTLCLIVTMGMWHTASEANVAKEFKDATLFVVYSSTDEDAQIFIRAASDTPLRMVKMFGPGGLLPIRWKSQDGARLGHGEFLFETPEPSLDELIAAYPAGRYRFVGRTVENQRLVSDVELSYDLLPAPQITFPANGDTGVPVQGLVVTWNAVPNAQGIRLEIEDEGTGVSLKVDLPGDASSFNVPDHWLQPGTEYVLDIKAIAENGNQTVTDLRFTTEA